MPYELRRKYTDVISAGHSIKGYVGKCAFPHGHNWDVEVIYKSDKLNKLQMVADFKDIDKMVFSVTSQVDHHIINKVLQTDVVTAEVLVRWLYTQLKKFNVPDIELVSVEVWETRGHSVKYYENAD